MGTPSLVLWRRGGPGLKRRRDAWQVADHRDRRLDREACRRSTTSAPDAMIASSVSSVLDAIAGGSCAVRRPEGRADQPAETAVVLPARGEHVVHRDLQVQ